MKIDEVKVLLDEREALRRAHDDYAWFLPPENETDSELSANQIGVWAKKPGPYETTYLRHDCARLGETLQAEIRRMVCAHFKGRLNAIEADLARVEGLVP